MRTHMNYKKKEKQNNSGHVESNHKQMKMIKKNVFLVTLLLIFLSSKKLITTFFGLYQKSNQIKKNGEPNGSKKSFKKKRNQFRSNHFPTNF